MNEKSEKVLEQYDIGIRRMTRGRGGIILSTDKGYKLFIQCEKADKYYERENRITSLLSKVGYSCTDTYMRNNEGGLISEDEDGRKYILKNWYDAKESSVRDEDDMCRAVVAMAYMHMALRQITPEMLYADNEASQGAGIIYTGNGVYTKDNKNKVLQKLLLIHGIFFPSCFIVPMFPVFNANTGNIVGTILLEIWCAYFLPICILGYNYFHNNEKK